MATVEQLQAQHAELMETWHTATAGKRRRRTSSPTGESVEYADVDSDQLLRRIAFLERRIRGMGGTVEGGLTEASGALRVAVAG